MHTKFDYKLFDLEPRDVLLYEVMLCLDKPTSIRTIATEAKLNRGTTFELIKKLVEVGLIGSHYKNKRKYYFAQPPAQLNVLARNRLEQVSEEVVIVEKYAKELIRKAVQPDFGQFTRFYDGEDEIAALLGDVLDTVGGQTDKTYRVVSSAEIRNHLYGKFRNFTKQRIKRGIFARVIAIGKGGDLSELAERRFLSSENIPAAYLIIYEEKIAQISLSDRGKIQGVVVQNPGLNQLNQLLFDQLWATLPE